MTTKLDALAAEYRLLTKERETLTAKMPNRLYNAAGKAVSPWVAKSKAVDRRMSQIEQLVIRLVLK